MIISEPVRIELCTSTASANNTTTWTSSLVGNRCVVSHTSGPSGFRPDYYTYISRCRTTYSSPLPVLSLQLPSDYEVSEAYFHSASGSSESARGRVYNPDTVQTSTPIASTEYRFPYAYKSWRKLAIFAQLPPTISTLSLPPGDHTISAQTACRITTSPQAPDGPWHLETLIKGQYIIKAGTNVQVSAPDLNLGTVPAGQGRTASLPITITSENPWSGSIFFRTAVPRDSTTGEIGLATYRVRLPPSLGGTYANLTGENGVGLSLPAGPSLIPTNVILDVPPAATPGEYSTNLTITVKQD